MYFYIRLSLQDIHANVKPLPRRTSCLKDGNADFVLGDFLRYTLNGSFRERRHTVYVEADRRL